MSRTYRTAARQISARQQTPVEKADAMIKHLASTGVISNFRYVDGNRHLDQVLDDLRRYYERHQGD